MTDLQRWCRVGLTGQRCIVWCLTYPKMRTPTCSVSLACCCIGWGELFWGHRVEVQLQCPARGYGCSVVHVLSREWVGWCWRLLWHESIVTGASRSAMLHLHSFQQLQWGSWQRSDLLVFWNRLKPVVVHLPSLLPQLTHILSASRLEVNVLKWRL